MTPVVVKRSEHRISRRDISPEALKVLYRINECGFLAYLAGGSVRDILVGRKPKDFDVATDATPNDMRRMFRNCRLVGRRFRLAHVFFGHKIIEVATFRAEATQQPTVTAVSAKHEAQQPHAHATGDHLPPKRGGHAIQLKRHDGLILRDNVFGTPEADARRRDFTVNALFYSIRDFSVIDYVGGLEDLGSGIIRCIGDPAVRYTEDPVRMIRAVRFAATLGFKIERDTYHAILKSSQSLANASNARMYEEVLKLLLCGAAEKAVEHLVQTGLWAVMFPQLSAWMEHADRAGRLETIKGACRRADAMVNSGRPGTPALMLALLFRQYHEARAEHLTRQGMRRGEALRTVTTQHLAELSGSVLIPRRIGDQITHILIHGPSRM